MGGNANAACYCLCKKQAFYSLGDLFFCANDPAELDHKIRNGELDPADLNQIAADFTPSAGATQSDTC